VTSTGTNPETTDSAEVWCTPPLVGVWDYLHVTTCAPGSGGSVRTRLVRAGAQGDCPVPAFHQATWFGVSISAGSSAGSSLAI